MFNAARLLSGATLTGALLFAAVGCGDSAPPPKGAGDKISEAQGLINSGDMAYQKRNYPAAKSNYKSAKEVLADARSLARESERSKVKSLADEVTQKIDDTELKEITDNKVDVKPVVNEVKKLEDAEAKQKLADKAKADAEAKKNAQAQADLEKVMAKKDSTGSKKDEDAGAPAAAKKPGDADKGGGKVAGGDAANPDEPPKAEEAAILPARAPFAAVTAKTPEIMIVKIATKGTFVYAYFQVNNTTEDDHRVNTIDAYFKDKDNQTVIDHCTAFPFDGFKTDTHKDMIAEQVIDAITLGSDIVQGSKARRYVVIGEHPSRVKDIKKVAVRVNFDNYKALVETGP